jgi:tetratricopeptide (TPR) repeat protein
MAFAMECLEGSEKLSRLEECRSSELAFEKGCSELGEGRPAEAAASFELARRSGPVPSGAYGKLAGAAWDAGWAEEAFMAARLARDNRPDYAGLNQYCGCEGEAPFELTERTRMAREESALAATEFEGGRVEAAIDALGRSAALDPSRARTLLRLGAAQEYLGLHAEAARAYARASELDGKERGLPREIEEVGRDLLTEAELRWLAERRAGKAAEIGKSKEAADKGVGAFNAGDAREAERWLERAVRLNADNAQAWLSLGAVRSSAGDLSGGQACYEAALRGQERRRAFEALLGIQKKPDIVTVAILSSLAEGRLKQGRRAQAAADIRSALAEAPPAWEGRPELERLLKDAER